MNRNILGKKGGHIRKRKGGKRMKHVREKSGT
jgi:hypothetical protein